MGPICCGLTGAASARLRRPRLCAAKWCSSPRNCWPRGWPPTSRFAVSWARQHEHIRHHDLDRGAGAKGVGPVEGLFCGALVDYMEHNLLRALELLPADFPFAYISADKLFLINQVDCCFIFCIPERHFKLEVAFFWVKCKVFKRCCVAFYQY